MVKIISGWKALREDVEFLSDELIEMFWIITWFGVPLIIIPFFLWWNLTMISSPFEWKLHSCELWAMITFGVIVLVFTIFAILSIVKQVQYDFVSVSSILSLYTNI